MNDSPAMAKTTLSRKLLLGVAVLITPFLAFQILPPPWINSALYSVYARQAGVRSTAVETQAGAVQAYEGGSQNSGKIPVVLLHGFGDSRISFLQSARWLTPEYQVLLPEFPGFGDGPQDPTLSHSIRAQVERVHALLDARGIQKAHLVGNSMGGHIAAAFALRYPERMGKLILLSPAGLRVDDPIPYRPQARPIQNEADYDAFMDQLFYKRPWIPGPFKREFIRNAANRFDWLQKIRGEIRDGEDYVLNDRIHDIHAPTLIIWGRHDGVVHVAHAPVWHEGIPGSKLLIQEDSGHSPQYEYPERTARQILDFLKEGASQ